jgi:predicted transcriptional regulator
MAEIDNEMHETLITLTSDIVAAHVGNNDVTVDQLPQLIGGVYSALAGLGAPAPEPEAPPQPAVPVRSSVKKDRIVCLEDGMELKMLKRHLMTHHNMTPAEYRQRWNLPSDYPMVAPLYAETRRDLAKKIGLGRKPGTKMPPKAAAGSTKAPAKRGRPRKTDKPAG